MSRVWLIPVVVLVGALAPSVVQAQYAVVSPCGGAYRSPSVWDDCARVSVIPAPPTGVPAWLQPKPAAPPVVVPLLPVTVAPAAPSRGLDPWIPLAGPPAPVARPTDLLGQMLLLEQLAAAREQRQQAAPAPAYRAPSPARQAAPRPQPAATTNGASGDGWMSAWMKGVK